MENLSIRQALLQNKPINVNEGTFGKSGGGAYYDRWVDRVTLTTTGVKYSLFNTPVDSSGRTPADTNTVANVIPQGQRADLTGIEFFLHSPSGAAITATQKAAFNAWAQSAWYTISFGSTIVRKQPLWVHLGSQLAQELSAATIGVQSPLPKRLEWIEPWPEVFFLPLQSGVNMTFTIESDAPGADLNTFKFGVAFERYLASMTP